VPAADRDDRGKVERDRQIAAKDEHARAGAEFGEAGAGTC